MASFRSVAAFNAAVLGFAKEGDAEASLIVRKYILLGLKGVVMKTPVDTGRARGGWQTSAGRPVRKDPDRPDKGGGATISAQANKVAPFVKQDPYQLFWITNAVSYIVPLEEGHSQQARNGMLEVTFQELLATL